MRAAHLNTTLHGRSWSRHSDHPGHNVFHGWLHPGTGDALDIYAPVGTPVFAIADGRVSRYRGHGTTREHIYLSGPGFVATYAHIHSRHGVGAHLKQGDEVGTLIPLHSGAHLHFELWLGEHAVHAATPEKLRQRMLTQLDAQ